MQMDNFYETILKKNFFCGKNDEERRKEAYFFLRIREKQKIISPKMKLQLSIRNIQPESFMPTHLHTPRV